MVANTSIKISERTQEAIIKFSWACYSTLISQWNIREQLRQRDLQYIRENDYTKENLQARAANRAGDPTKFQNVVVPIVMPQVEAAVTYQSSVFLTGVPIFGWVAPPGQEDTALQMQAITEENQVRGGWINQFMMFFRDGFKYNLGAVECVWDRKTTWDLETDLTFQSGKVGKPKKVIWEGNCIKRWDLYNSFWDLRVHPTDLYSQGEFAGRTEVMSRMALKKFLADLPDGMVQNYRKAFESGIGAIGPNTGGVGSYYIPQLNPSALIPYQNVYSFDWLQWAGLLDRPAEEIQYKNIYEVTTLYARILPIDFGMSVPERSSVQIWKFIIINHQVLVYAERQTNVHDNLPVFIGQPNQDGLDYQTKSLADNAQPFQAIGSALVNSAIAARRRAISDRMIYDPSRISETHINSDSPTAKIPLRPSAFGKPVTDSVYAIPFRDDQSAVAFQELPQMYDMANKVNGQNPAKQGQFVKGNKTLREYDSIMSNANGRDQMTSYSYEGQVFTPLKEVLKSNIFQYQPSTEIYSPAQKATVPINPVDLRKAIVTFTVTDGLMPTEKVISGDELTTALQILGSSPSLAQQYNLGPVFSYLMKTRNADLTPFEKTPQQIQYEQAAAQWQQVAELAIQKGQGQAQIPPQPTPQQYGWDPQTGQWGGTPATPGTPQNQPVNVQQANAGRTIQ